MVPRRPTALVFLCVIALADLRSHKLLEDTKPDDPADLLYAASKPVARSVHTLDLAQLRSRHLPCCIDLHPFGNLAELCLDGSNQIIREDTLPQGYKEGVRSLTVVFWDSSGDGRRRKSALDSIDLLPDLLVLHIACLAAQPQHLFSLPATDLSAITFLCLSEVVLDFQELAAAFFHAGPSALKVLWLDRAEHDTYGDEPVMDFIKAAIGVEDFRITDGVTAMDWSVILEKPLIKTLGLLSSEQNDLLAAATSQGSQSDVDDADGDPPLFASLETLILRDTNAFERANTDELIDACPKLSAVFWVTHSWGKASREYRAGRLRVPLFIVTGSMYTADYGFDEALLGY